MNNHNEPIIWGVNANNHQASLTIIKGKHILFASLSERFSRKKNDRFLNTEIINYGLRFGNPDHIVFSCIPWKKSMTSLLSGKFHLSTKSDFKKIFSDSRIHCKNYHFRDHHHCHAANAWYTSPFEKACILVIDAVGDITTTSCWVGKKGNLKCLWRTSYPHSLGLFYSYFTSKMGFQPNEEEFYLMALAAWGKPKYSERILKDFFLDGEILVLKKKLHFVDNKPLKGAKEDWASSVQLAFETKFSELLEKAKKTTHQSNLCLVGGCALNCVANRLVFKHFNDCWIPSAPGDGGNSLGAALLIGKPETIQSSAYLGYNLKVKYPVKEGVEALQAQGLIAIANGKAEFGPRALGNRSILADTERFDAIQKLNTIKSRAKYRPFAPVVRKEIYHNFFHQGPPESPFMHHIYKCRDKTKMENVVAIDGSSRLQTVSRKQHPNLWELLYLWEKKTGKSVLLNTSMNLRGEPIVNNEIDARNFKRKTDIITFYTDPP